MERRARWRLGAAATQPGCLLSSVLELRVECLAQPLLQLLPPHRLLLRQLDAVRGQAVLRGQRGARRQAAEVVRAASSEMVLRARLQAAVRSSCATERGSLGHPSPQAPRPAPVQCSPWCRWRRPAGPCWGSCGAGTRRPHPSAPPPCQSHWPPRRGDRRRRCALPRGPALGEQASRGGAGEEAGRGGVSAPASVRQRRRGGGAAGGRGARSAIAPGT